MIEPPDDKTPEELQRLADITAQGISLAKEKFKFPPMIEPPSEDDKRHAASDYLHFEHDNPATCDIYFDSFEEAVEFIDDRGWSFVTEDWEPFNMFEARIECKDQHGGVVGQLLMLTIKLWED